MMSQDCSVFYWTFQSYFDYLDFFVDRKDRWLESMYARDFGEVGVKKKRIRDAFMFLVKM